MRKKQKKIVYQLDKRAKRRKLNAVIYWKVKCSGGGMADALA